MTHPTFTKAQRLATFEQFGAIVCCQGPDCDSAIYIRGCDIDHHLAIIDGGKHELENWRPLCGSCHAKKSAHEHSENARAKRRFVLHTNPRMPCKVWPSRKMESRPFPKPRPEAAE